MNILDYVIPKKGLGYLMPQPDAGEEEGPQTGNAAEPASAEAEDPGPAGAATVSPPEMEADPPTQREEQAAPAAPEPEAAEAAAAPSPDRADSYGSDGPLDAGLRDLFSEASVMDPQLASLVKGVDRVSAEDLAAELRDFSRAIGAEGAGSGGRTPG